MMADQGTYLIVVRGLVQGVGFRPFVYRVARRHGLKGWVLNTNEDVRIAVNATPRELRAFIRSLKEEAPPASELASVHWQGIDHEAYSDFLIRKSEDASDRITGVSPDIAVCPECLQDMKQQDHRIDYPFLNCTNCGPRFSIIRELPYDRPGTTMNEFEMCGRCSAEYHDVSDRRFHAQPVACTHCGPVYELHASGRAGRDPAEVVSLTAKMIDKGLIVAMKGMGGYHLACDALSEDAVSRLRASKKRENKPFAVMFRDLQAAGQYAHINDIEAEWLGSWRSPIVILQEKKSLAPSVSVGFHTTGGMLPYMPFHYLLFEHLKTPVIVLTSGNLSDEPVITGNEEALRVLRPVSDAVLVHNREIHNRTDDSVLQVSPAGTSMIRRSRGFVPNPVRLSLDADQIFAAGAELVNCFCLGRDNQAIMSQHIGDLKNFETYAFYRESATRFMKLFRLDAELIAHDMHPDYLSTRFALGLDKKTIAVQHHHAHIASVMAEHGIDEQVIGVGFDGTGYGTDGHTWGGEFLVCDLAGFERFRHFRYVPMPGGDLVTREPWRMAVSCLYQVYGRELIRLNLPFLARLPEKKLHLIIDMIDKGVNAPLSSSAGRLFDAVSAMINLCPVAGFHAEAPMRLENSIDHAEQGSYPFRLAEGVDFSPLFEAIHSDLKRGTGTGVMAARFHNTMTEVILQACREIRQDRGLSRVLLSGGTFQNRYLLERSMHVLEQAGFSVDTNTLVPANDGGIALGQLAVAARKRETGC